MNNDQFRRLAFTFSEVEEKPHFEKTSFRVRKKIFATLDQKKEIVCLKVNEVDQSVFCDISRGAIYPVPNKWGKQGWTLVELQKVNDELLKDALKISYCSVAPKDLAARYNSES